MADSSPSSDLLTRPRVAILAALAVIGLVKAGAWLHFRRRQPDLDERTRARLRPLDEA